MKGLILAGGLGTRLRPLTYTGSKQLIPVANKPVLFYGIEDLKEAGIRDIGIIVGYTEERIQFVKDSVGDGSRWGVRITYIRQDAPRGLAHAVATAREFIGDDDFVVYLGDNILSKGIKEFAEEFRGSDKDASILVTQVENPEMYGVALINDGGEITEIEEKPENPKSNYAIVGVYFFRSSIFKAIERTKPGKGGELQLTDAIRELIASKGHRVNAHVVRGWWDDTGTAEAVLRANQLTLMDLKPGNRGRIERDVRMMGNVSVGRGTVIREGSAIKGPVIIGENCRIGPKTYIGPYTSIGNNVTVENGEIECSVVMDNTVIKINGKIVDSLIGKDVKIKTKENLPKGYRFILGERSEVSI